MTIAEAIQRDASNIITDVPVVFSWGGADYEGTRGALAEESPLEQGGFLDTPTLIISTSLKRFNPITREMEDRFPFGAALPAIRDLVICRGVTYAISRVVTDEHGSILQMDLKSPNV